MARRVNAMIVTDGGVVDAVALQIVCELISKESIGYLATESTDEYESAPFAAGGIVTPALFDILLAQSFYAPHVRAIALLCGVLVDFAHAWAAAGGPLSLPHQVCVLTRVLAGAVAVDSWFLSWNT